MPEISIRKVKTDDEPFFAKWWRDEDLLKLTSGVMEPISDEEVEKYFEKLLNDNVDYHFMILADEITIGHLSLVKRGDGWYETQIVIGDNKYQGLGYGPQAIMLLLEKAKYRNINKIFLDVRPTNTNAIKAYEKCGFKKQETIKHPDNKFLPETLRMEL